MIVICGECGLKYQIDPVKIKGEQARLKCRGCSTSITVNKPATEGYGEENKSSYQQNEYTLEIDDQESEEAINAVEERVQGSLAAEIHKRTGLGVTTKAIILLLLVSLIPTGLYFLISSFAIGDELNKDITSSGQNASQALVTDVDEWIDKNIRALKVVAQLRDMQGMNRYQQEVLLKSLQKEYPWVTLAFTTNKEGLNIARSDEQGLKDFSNRSYFKDITLKEKEAAWQALIGKASKKPSLVLSVPIKEKRRVIGVLGAAMSREVISKFITDYQKGNTGFAFLVDESGKVLVHPNNQFILEQKDLSSHPVVRAGKNQVKSLIEYTDDDNQNIIGFAHTTNQGWTVVIQQNKDEAYAALNKAKIYGYIILLIAFFAAIVIAYYASRTIVDPIVNMTDAANRVSNGESGVEIINISTDEIGNLADAITRMQDSLCLSISRLQLGRK